MGTVQEDESNQRTTQPDERDHKREVWWFRQPVPIDRFTGWLVAWTALLFIATFINALILLRTDYTLKDTLEASNRAWIAIISASLDNVPAEGLQILAHLTYKNAGHSPAVKMNYMMLLQQLPVADERHGRETPKDDICMMVPRGDLTVFPGYEYAASFPRGGEGEANSKLMSGKDIMYWRGCFQYDTFGKTRRTQFCFYLRHSGPEWYWQDCGTNAN